LHLQQPAFLASTLDTRRGCLQVLGEMLYLSQGFQDTIYSTNLEVWVVILVAACLLLSVVQVLGVMGIFGKFVQPKGAVALPMDGTALFMLCTMVHMGQGGGGVILVAAWLLLVQVLGVMDILGTFLQLKVAVALPIG